MKNNENKKTELNLARIFGFFLNYHRKKKGWSLENMGNALFLSYSTIRRIENGEYLPEKNERDHIARLFGYDSFLENQFQIEEYNRQVLIVRQEQTFRNDQRLLEKIHSFLNVKALKASYFFPQYVLLQIYKSVMDSKELSFVLRSFEEMLPYLHCFSEEQKAIIYDLIGSAYLNDHQFAQSITYFQKAARHNDTDLLVHMHAAMVYQYLKCDHECLNKLDICKQLLFQCGSVYRMFQISQIEALVRAERGELKIAKTILLNLYKEAKRLKDDYLIDNLLNNLAYVFFISEDYLNAILYSKEAIRKNYKHIDSVLYLYIVYSYFKTGQFDEMNKVIENCKQELLEKHIRFLIPGIEAWSKKNYRQAEEKFYIAYCESELRKEIDWKVWILNRLIELNCLLEDVERILYYSNVLYSLNCGIQEDFIEK